MNTDAYNELELCYSETRKWDLDMKCKGQWPAPRSFHTTTAVGRRVVTGGRGQDNNHHADFHIFDTGELQTDLHRKTCQ